MSLTHSFLPIAWHCRPEENSTVIFLCAVILLSLGTFASILGRAASTNLRCLVNYNSLSVHSGISSADALSWEYLFTESTSGRSSELLSVIGAAIGVVVNSGMWALSVNRERPSQYDGSLCLFLPSLLTFSLYFASYFLRISPEDKVRRFGWVNDFVPTVYKYSTTKLTIQNCHRPVPS